MLHSITQNPAVRAIMAPALAVRRAVQTARARAAREHLGRLRSLLAADPVVHLDAFEGDFAISPQSDLFGRIVVDGSYEPDLARLCVAHLDPERDAIDVGTNVGFFAVLMARHLPGRRVLAVEPTPGALARLAANLERNGVADTVVTFEGAVADRPGRRGITVIDGREEYASLGPLMHAAAGRGASRLIEVAVSTVDDLVQEHGLTPGFLKVDVEGAELAVFEGAVETLRRHRPVVLSEFSPTLLEAQGASAGQIIEFFQDLGYSLSDPSYLGAPVGARGYGDLLAVPL